MPTPPAFGDEDYQQAMLRLSPRGHVWRRDASSTLSAVLLALAPTYTRSTEAAARVLIDASPATTVNLLEEWEESLGLPDPCTAPNPPIEQRRAAVRAKFGARGALTPAYFIALAAALGFAITITEFSPFAVDMSCDLPIVDSEWSFVWQVNAPQITTFYFSADESSVDDPLETYDSGELGAGSRATCRRERSPSSSSPRSGKSMQRIIDPTASATLPAPPALTGTTGYFTGGVPGISAATRVRYWFVNMIQEELMSLLAAAGVAADTTATTFNQVLLSIQALIGAIPHGVQTFTSPGAISFTVRRGIGRGQPKLDGLQRRSGSSRRDRREVIACTALSVAFPSGANLSGLRRNCRPKSRLIDMR